MSLGLAMHQFATVARGTKYSKKWCNVANGLQPKKWLHAAVFPLVSEKSNCHGFYILFGQASNHIRRSRL